MKKKVISIIAIIIGILALAFGVLYAVDMNRMKNNKAVVFSTWGYKYCPPAESITEETTEKSRIKISDVILNEKENEITSTCDMSKLVKFNGVLYAKSYALIDYGGNINETIGVIDKLIDEEYLPNLNGETNSEELLNAKVLEANEKIMVLAYNNNGCENDCVLFESIQVSYKTTECNDDVQLMFYQKTMIKPEQKEIIISKGEITNIDYNIYAYEGHVAVQIDGEWKSLRDMLLQGKITINDILEKANKDLEEKNITGDMFKDGGTMIYQYDSYTIIKYNCIDGDKDLYIGPTTMNYGVGQ